MVSMINVEVRPFENKMCSHAASIVEAVQPGIESRFVLFKTLRLDSCTRITKSERKWRKYTCVIFPLDTCKGCFRMALKSFTKKSLTLWHMADGSNDGELREVKSCGFLVMKSDQSFLLMKHPNRYDLPKGHMEAEETEYQTAIRGNIAGIMILNEVNSEDSSFRTSGGDRNPIIGYRCRSWFPLRRGECQFSTTFFSYTSPCRSTILLTNALAANEWRRRLSFFWRDWSQTQFK